MNNLIKLSQSKDKPETQIKLYFHCSKCIKEKPDNVSPQEWQRNESGWTKKGFQVWCLRHNCNLVHVDFEGQQHPADLHDYGDFK